MKRKDYEKPTIEVVMLQHQMHLLQASGSIKSSRNGYDSATSDDDDDENEGKGIWIWD